MNRNRELVLYNELLLPPRTMMDRKWATERRREKLHEDWTFIIQRTKELPATTNLIWVTAKMPLFSGPDSVTPILWPLVSLFPGRCHSASGEKGPRWRQSITIKYSLQGKWDDNSMNKLHFRVHFRSDSTTDFQDSASLTATPLTGYVDCDDNGRIALLFGITEMYCQSTLI